MFLPAGLGDSRSTLGRLFMYSKDSLVTAHENFTTEAIAACIRADPNPMLAALCDLTGSHFSHHKKNPDSVKAGLATFVADATWIRVQTQVFLPDGGFLDAVLALGNGKTGVIGEVWLEVKINSPEGIGQLAAYVKAASALTRDDGIPRDVVTLSKVQLQPSVSWLDWRRLYVAAAGSHDPWWQDLRRFMEETQVSNAAMLPISDREAGSMAEAAGMFAKVSDVIRHVNRRASELWPDPPMKNRVHWSSEGALLNHVGAIFRQHGRMTMDGNHLRYGAVDIDGTAYWYLAVRARGQRPATFQQIVLDARGRGLGPEWAPRLEAEEVIARTARVAEYNEHKQAVEWFAEGLAQLRASDLIARIASVGPAEPIGSGPEDAAVDSEPVQTV